MQNLTDILGLPHQVPTGKPAPSKPTYKVEQNGSSLLVEVKPKDDSNNVDDEAVRDIVREAGLDPTEWAPNGFRTSAWTMANGKEGKSLKYSFTRKASTESGVPDEDLVRMAMESPASPWVFPEAAGEGFVTLLGDIQLGKLESDGAEIERCLSAIKSAADLLCFYRELNYPIGHVHIGWLGDHVEGFESQGGKNAWRTPIDLTTQLRVMRRIMMRAVQEFAPLTPRLTVAAVPGNHGRVSVNGGITRFNDNFDTDCLVAVADACALNPEAFGHVEFYVPEPDEMTVVVEVAGTSIAHAHGHQWRPGRHFEWWKGQAFGGRLASCDVLVAGHLHHLHIDTWGKQMFIQAPSLETESTWYRHQTGTPGSPGIVTFLCKDKEVHNIDILRASS